MVLLLLDVMEVQVEVAMLLEMLEAQHCVQILLQFALEILDLLALLLQVRVILQKNAMVELVEEGLQELELLEPNQQVGILEAQVGLEYQWI